MILNRRAADQLEQALSAGLVPDATTRPGRLTSELVGVATALRTLPDPVPGPSASFCAELRERLDTEAAVLAAARAALPTQRRSSSEPAAVVRVGRKRRVLAGTVAAVLVSGTAAAVASTGALPGDVLYPIKRSIEDVRGAVGGDAARGSAALDAARERLDEAAALVLRADPGDVDDAHALLLDFGASTRLGTSLLFGAYTSDGDPAHLQEVQDFVAESEPRLGGVRADAPEGLRPTIDALLALLRDLGGDLGQTLAVCGAPCVRAGVTGVEVASDDVEVRSPVATSSSASGVPTSSVSNPSDTPLAPAAIVGGALAPSAAPTGGAAVAGEASSGTSGGVAGSAAAAAGSPPVGPGPGGADLLPGSGARLPGGSAPSPSPAPVPRVGLVPVEPVVPSVTTPAVPPVTTPTLPAPLPPLPPIEGPVVPPIPSPVPVPTTPPVAPVPPPVEPQLPVPPPVALPVPPPVEPQLPVPPPVEPPVPVPPVGGELPGLTTHAPDADPPVGADDLDGS